jgi:hypothetical protein
MLRPGADPENVSELDFLCDFCGSTWKSDRPMIEGHKGSLICGHCLTAAYTQVVLRNAGLTVPEHVACTLCLLNKSGDYWQSGTRVEVREEEVQIELEPGNAVCRWCIERSAGMLSKDGESGWKKPG